VALADIIDNFLKSRGVNSLDGSHLCAFDRQWFALLLSVEGIEDQMGMQKWRVKLRDSMRTCFRVRFGA
jgi:hypothetical protein